MSQSANDLQTLNGLFKEVYSKQGIEELIPENYKMLNIVKFASKDEQTGRQYVQPVILNAEHGITYAGPNEDVFQLNPPIAGNVKDALVKGYQMLMRSAIGYASISRSAGGDQKAFKDATKVVVENMMRSFSKKLEIRLMYGQMGLGVVASAAADVLTIEAAEFAAGIWGGSENMVLEIRSSAGVLKQTASIQKADLSAKTLTLDAAVVGSVVAGDVLWEKGSHGKEMPGLHKILTNTGVLFDIDAAQFSLWQANQYSAGSAQLSFEKIQEAVALAVAKGLDTDVTLILSHVTWATLMTDEAALRKYDYSYSAQKSENGAREIKFHSQNGEIKLVPSIYCKEGYAYIVSPDEMMRIGSTDMTFKRPGRGTEEFFRELENSSGYELRLYSDQSLFCYAPGRNTIITAISN